MLGPGNRTLLFDSLKPDGGYRLDHVFITTYTLDLTALLSVPLAITFQAWDDADGSPPHAIAVLDALRSNADRVTVVTQAGGIGVPQTQRNVFALVEDAVRSVGAPAGGVFHPKVWIIRFEPEDAGDPVRYRLVVSSRNLTFDRSWDLALVLDGAVDDGADRGLNAPLAGFVTDVAGLVGESGRPLDEVRVSKVGEFIDELRGVAWNAPEGMRLEAFHPIGFDQGGDACLRALRPPLLVISPFVGSRLLRDLPAEPGDDSVLIGRQEELDLIDADVRNRFTEIFVLSGIVDEPTEPADTEGKPVTETPSESGVAGLRGLHAKLFVGDVAYGPRLLVGSANATSAAFTQNVEFMVGLKGIGQQLKLDAMTTDGGELRTLLDPYRPNEQPVDSEARRLAEQAADEAIRNLALSNAELTAHEVDEEGWTVTLTGAIHHAAVDMKVWPITLNEGRARDLGSAEVVAWTGLPATQVSAFLGVSATARSGNVSVERRSAILLPLNGAPVDRAARVVREILESSGGLMRYLALLLADLDSDPAAVDRLLAELAADLGDPAEARDGSTFEFPVFEGLLRALDKDPERLDRFESLIAGQNEIAGEAVFPEGFEEIWQPIIEARRRLAKKAN